MCRYDGALGRGRRAAAVALIAMGLGAAGCGAGVNAVSAEPPAKLEAVAGTSVKKVTLTQQAARRIGIETVAIAPAFGGGTTAPAGVATVVPYSAVLYTPDGSTWVYTVPQPLTYVREKVTVAAVGGRNGTEATLSAGPPVGTTVVTVGVIELYGAEHGVGKYGS
jgi:hypothetical protein